MLLLSQGPAFWRLFCPTLSFCVPSHALKTDILTDTASAGVLCAEQTSLSSKPYYMTPLSKRETQ